MEASRSKSPEAHETPCPACGALIGTASIGRRRRVQCPKCRNVVDVTARENTLPATPSLPFPAAEEPLAALAKIAALEARIAALEAAAKSFATAQPLEIVVPRPERKWKWLAHSSGHEAERLPTFVAETLLQNLQNYDGSEIHIHIPPHDPRSATRAKSLKEVFERAAWTVRGPIELPPGSHTESGLFLAVGGLPLPPAAAAAYFALSTSGFTVQSFLDPKLPGEQTILLIG